MSEFDKENWPIPENGVVYQDTSKDGLLTITVWRDSEPETDLMRELGGMGTVRIYNSRTGELFHEERVALSPSAIFGPGPTEEESKRWSNIVSLFTED